LTLSHLLPRMTAAMHMLTERMIAKRGARKAIRERRPNLKSIGQVVTEYQNALENLVVDATNGNIGAGAFRTQHNTLIDELAQPAYIEGQSWSVVGARTVGQSENVFEVGAGWPGIHVSYLRGVHPSLSLGARLTFEGANR